MIRNTHSKYSAPLLCAALLLTAGGCEQRPEKPRVASQSVVRVNGEEITIHQVNDEIALLGAEIDANSEKPSLQIVDALIDQNLAAQKARAENLHRDPHVLRSFAKAEQQILAQAYLSRRTSSVPQPTREEIKSYFTGHPELFSKSKIYTLRSITWKSSALTPVLDEKVRTLQSADEITAWLRMQNIPFQEMSVMKPAGMLPFELLEKIYPMGKGEILFIKEDSDSTVFELVDAVEHPLSEAQAFPLIEGFLLNEKRKEAVRRELQRLRSMASIEYVGKFAHIQPAAARQTLVVDTPQGNK
ncbi:MAG: EpsD family peptidyl-prolyl cis-trans isomerase [Pseudomonadota bacterium]